MKKLIYLVIIVASCFVSCTHGRLCCVVAQPAAKVTADRNGQIWSTFAVQSQLGITDSLIIAATQIVNQQAPVEKADSLTFKIANVSVGTYQLTSGQAFYTMFNANGSITACQLDPAFNNVFTVTGYSVLDNPYSTVPDETKITGTFSVRFINPNSATGITFSGGSFYVLTVHQ